jgi:hypothetical protein
MLKIIEPRLTSCFRALGETNGFRGKVWDSPWVRLKRRPVLGARPDEPLGWITNLRHDLPGDLTHHLLYEHPISSPIKSRPHLKSRSSEGLL